jgi:N-acetyl sugar amidotransferase
LKYCTCCVLPDTKPGLTFNEQGVCSACQWAEQKKSLDWEARAQQFGKLCDSIRGSNGNGYDCIVPVSGGKDSMYQLWMMSHIHRMLVLGVVLVPHLQTEEGIRNLNAMVSGLNVDLLKVAVKPSTLKKLRTKCFFEIGNPNWAEHRVVFSAVVRMALFYHVPLVVWGEDIGLEFGGTVKQTDGSADDLIDNDLFREAGLERFIDDDLPERELFFYQYPDKEELRHRKISSVYLGHYYNWDGYKHYQKALEFGFQGRKAGPLSANVLDYDNIDEKLCEIHIWFKFLKLGFWRPTDQCCYQIWNGRMTREEAVTTVNDRQYEFPEEYYTEFLEYHGMSDEQFWQAVDRFRNRDIWVQERGRWRLRYPLE